jgi:hypothetical protein
LSGCAYRKLTKMTKIGAKINSRTAAVLRIFLLDLLTCFAQLAYYLFLVRSSDNDQEASLVD